MQIKAPEASAPSTTAAAGPTAKPASASSGTAAPAQSTTEVRAGMDTAGVATLDRKPGVDTATEVDVALSPPDRARAKTVHPDYTFMETLLTLLFMRQFEQFEQMLPALRGVLSTSQGPSSSSTRLPAPRGLHALISTRSARDYTPFLLTLQGMTLQSCKALPSLPSNITREATHRGHGRAGMHRVFALGGAVRGGLHRLDITLHLGTHLR